MDKIRNTMNTLLPSDLAGCKALVMGLGLHGGGVETARYLAKHGALVTVTDLRDKHTLEPSLEKLKDLPIRYVLGKHESADFEHADLVIKNPIVKPDSPFLQAAARVETDISLFLACSKARLLAVTGSKGKSTTASFLYYTLQEAHERRLLPAGKTFLGGNSSLSPLAFVDELSSADDVVLELSSWQLGDLRKNTLLKPRAAIITAIVPDHLNWYESMDAYLADKKLIFRQQDKNDCTVAGFDRWGQEFLRESRGRSFMYAQEPLPEGLVGGWLSGARGFARNGSGVVTEIVPERVLVAGLHQKMNMLAAGLALLDLGLDPDCIRACAGTFAGIEHRLEFFYERAGVRFYNDSAATVPQAALAAVSAFNTPVLLVTGGTDKNLDFAPLASAAAKAKAVFILAGSGSDKVLPLLKAAAVPYHGPYSALDEAVKAVFSAAEPEDTVVLSPGCASFGMFQNEFERGRLWKAAVREYGVSLDSAPSLF
jgi:UDP-N-acetylmuramoylalanine--D-glutamate ligase